MTTLAAQAGVTVRSMAHAVALLRQQGMLAVEPGRGIRIVPRDHEPVPSSPAGRWQSVASSILDDIHAGKYLPGEQLPAGKVLNARYGACYRTVRKALRSLHQARALETHKRGYRIPPGRVARPNARIILIAAENHRGQLQRFTPRTGEMLRALERQCSRIHARLQTLSYNRDSAVLRADGRVVAPPLTPLLQSPTLGVLVWSLGLPQSVVDWAVGDCTRAGIPSSVLDESGGVRLPQAAGGLSRLFRVAHDAAPGEQVGRYLSDLGHRQVVYVSPYHGNVWSPARLQGLRRAFDASGESGAVTALVSERYSNAWQYVSEAAHTEAAVRELLKRRSSASGTDAVLQRRVLDGLGQQLDKVLESEIPGAILEPLLEEALSLRSATAWVAAGDAVAVHCLRFLRQHAVQIPQELSLISFDDSPAAFANGLTSYNFDCPTIVSALLSHVQRSPTAPVTDTPPTPTDIEGFITLRGTCARPSGRNV